MAILFLTFGSIGTLFIWIAGIRPYVVSNKQGYKTGANLSIAMWVDWQTCGDISKAQDDAKGRRIYLAFGLFQLVTAIGVILLFL